MTWRVHRLPGLPTIRAIGGIANSPPRAIARLTEPAGRFLTNATAISTSHWASRSQANIRSFTRAMAVQASWNNCSARVTGSEGFKVLIGGAPGGFRGKTARHGTSIGDPVSCRVRCADRGPRSGDRGDGPQSGPYEHQGSR